ncbi:MAG: hypothetical protein R3C53_12140 [Pirellulaceae bacterium]
MTSIPIKHSRSPLFAIQRVCDVVTIGSTLYLSQWLAGQYPSDRTLLAIATAVIIFFIVGEVSSLYRHVEPRSANTDFALAISSWIGTVLLLACIAFFSRHGDYFARSSILGWIVLTGACLALERMLFRIVVEAFVSGGWASRRCAIAGLNPLGIQLLLNAKSNPECGLQVVGFTTIDPKSVGSRPFERNPSYWET